MVRLADEIVDTFHDHDKSELLQHFEQQTFDAVAQKISLNPVLHAFQLTVNRYNIDLSLIRSFFNSMRSDLTEKKYNKESYDQYVYGSAEVVGLMCLYVFCEGDRPRFDRLKTSARALGAAFQKVNFLRDMRADYNDLSRTYFPDCNFDNFTIGDKNSIEKEIEQDFCDAFDGIRQLPLKAKFGVYVAYKYYYSLFRKIKLAPPAKIMQTRFRIANHHKALIVFRAGLKMQLKML
jgi:phytoene/squalene synthetase